MNSDIAKERSPFNWSQIVGLISGVAMITWILAGIYFQFRSHENHMKTMEERIEYVNTRIDKKTTPLELEIKELKSYHKK